MAKTDKTADELDAEAAAAEQAKADEQATQDQTDSGEVASAETAVTPEIAPAENAEAVAVDPISGAATSAMAATGEVVHVPDSPEAVAEQATALGLANDHATGGYAPPTDTTNRQPVYTRVWAMDNDHTEKNRAGFDPVKPDCVTVQ